MIEFIKHSSIFSSIRSKLIALLLILVGLPLLIAGYLSYRSAYDALLKQTTLQLGNLTEKTAQQIDSFFQSAQKDVSLLADNPFVQLSFLQFEFRQRLDSAQRLLVDYSRKNGYYSGIYLIALDGKPILAVPSADLADLDFSRADWFIQTLHQGFYLSDVPPSAGSPKEGVFVGRVIHDFENVSQPVGVLAFHIKASAYFDFAASLQIGSRGHAMLMHRGGNILYHPDPRLRSMQDVVANGDERLGNLIRQMTAGERGHGPYTFFGEEKFLVYGPCRERPWSVAITVLKAELMADINRFQKRMLTFFAGIILLVLLISWLFIKSITHPIKQLIVGAGRIGRGNLNQTIHVTSNDEMRAVAEEFNKMAARLKTSMDEIIDLKNFNEDILRNVTSGIITVDRRGKITSFNAGATRIFDYSPSGSPGAAPESMPGHLQEALQELKATLETGQNVHHKELTISKAHQDSTYVEINTSLLTSMTGKVFGAIADIRDITQRKRMEEVMLRVEKLASLGELSAGMAHEIRNPLAGIKTSVQVLAKRVSKPESKELLQGIESEINRLDRIVTELLRFSKPAPPLAEPVDIARILDQTLDLLAEKIKTHAITIDRGFGPPLPEAVIDREQIRQVFLNLILNCIKAMEKGGRLTIEASPAAEAPNGLFQSHGLHDLQLSRYLKVVFADTGYGIAPEHLQKIFDPFFTTDPKGTGLGLSIAHKLIEENGGHIFIESLKGQGTRAILLLPTA